MSLLNPERQRGFEYLDDPALPAHVAEQSLRDISVANRWFGGTRAVQLEMRTVLEQARAQGVQSLTLLDVGTGTGDIPAALVADSERRRIRLHTIGLEHSIAFAALARQQVRTVVAGDARTLPFGDNSIDVVTCSLVLHHLTDNDATQMLRECGRVARRRVIVADLKRSWVPMVLLWLVSFPLRFHGISRHDGLTSIRRGYIVRELRELVGSATNVMVHCQSRLGWRITAAWSPDASVS